MENNKLLIIFVIAGIFPFFFSCGNNNTKKDRLFSEEKKIVFNAMNTGESLGRVFSIKSKDNYLIVIEKNMDTQLQLIDKKTKACYKFGRSGQGPEELLQCGDVIEGDNKHIEVYDAQKQTLFKFNMDSIIKRKEDCRPEAQIKVPMYPLSISRLREGAYVALGLMSGMKRFIFIDGNGKVISMEGALPEKKMNNINDIVHAFAYWGRLTTNQKENKIAVCTNYAGMIQIYDCKTGKVQLIKEHNLFSADYKEVDGNFAVTPQTRWGYLSIDSNEKFIYALYSGRNQMENPDGSFSVSGIIHVYDWEGNPVCRLLSDRKLQTICVDDENNLYGYDVEKEDIMVAKIKD
jgi:hypothetical protein